jgi:hypothetical protein
MMSIRMRNRNDGGSGWARRFLARVDWLRIRRATVFITVCWLFSNSAPKALPLSAETVEYPVKLAFLYNFTKFVEWPSDSFRNQESPLVICIVGNDPFGPSLEGELRSRTVGSHPIEVRALRTSDILSVCHMVFIPVTAEDQAAKVIRGLKGSSTLTVGETKEFAARGGIINLMAEGNKLHFEVNLLAAERAGLKISAKMLALAKIVHDESPSPEIETH